MEKKSIEQLARLHMDEVLCEPNVAPIMYKIRKHEICFFAHSINVAFISTQMGLQRGYFGEKLRDLIRGALLHDCGKLKIPVEILTKPDFLDEDEYDLIKEHPLMGVEILSGKGFSETVIDIVHHHHERLDGSGYPDGLICNQICEETEIVMVADSWDAMTSERPYKKSMDGEHVYDSLKNSELYANGALRLLRLCTDN